MKIDSSAPVDCGYHNCSHTQQHGNWFFWTFTLKCKNFPLVSEPDIGKSLLSLGLMTSIDLSRKLIVFFQWLSSTHLLIDAWSPTLMNSMYITKRTHSYWCVGSLAILVWDVDHLNHKWYLYDNPWYFLKKNNWSVHQNCAVVKYSRNISII